MWVWGKGAAYILRTHLGEIRLHGVVAHAQRRRAHGQLGDVLPGGVDVAPGALPVVAHGADEAVGWGGGCEAGGDRGEFGFGGFAGCFWFLCCFLSCFQNSGT